MSYTAVHARALLQVKRKGAPVTFTLSNAGVPNGLTGVPTGAASSSVAGHAVQTPGNPERYRALQLVETHAITLIFAPSTRPQMPALGATFTFGGVKWTVKAVDPVAPDGDGIVATVIGARG
jgi:hypothetical protein